MNWTEYRTACARTAWPGIIDEYLRLGLIGEVGEVVELVKKSLRPGRIAGLLREHAADLRARADRIEALADVPFDRLRIDHVEAELSPLRSSPLGEIAHVMIDAAREPRT